MVLKEAPVEGITQIQRGHGFRMLQVNVVIRSPSFNLFCVGLEQCEGFKCIVHMKKWQSAFYIVRLALKWSS